MVKKSARLYGTFKPSNYSLKVHKARNQTGLEAQLEISGQKIGRPSKRITLHQSGIKVKQADIIYYGKQSELKMALQRINHLKAAQEVRLHAKDMLFPGQYKLLLNFTANEPNEEAVYQLKTAKALSSIKNLRSIFPLIDEPEATAQASFQFK